LRRAKSNWNEYLGLATATLPAGSLVHTLQVDTETIMAPIAAPTGVLMPARMGMVTWDVSFPTIQAMHDWVTTLEDIPGYVDARSVRVYWTTVDYRATVIFTFDQNALAHRFDGGGTDGGQR
jgi:hypothetical protein